MDITNNNLCDNSMSKIIDQLILFNIKKLKLSSNVINEKSIESLNNYLNNENNNCLISDLELNDCSLVFSTFSKLFTILSKNTSIKYIQIKNNNCDKINNDTFKKDREAFI